MSSARGGNLEKICGNSSGERNCHEFIKGHAYLDYHFLGDIIRQRTLLGVS